MISDTTAVATAAGRAACLASCAMLKATPPERLEELGALLAQRFAAGERPYAEELYMALSPIVARPWAELPAETRTALRLFTAAAIGVLGQIRAERHA